jgi:hypothetical protein
MHTVLNCPSLLPIAPFYDVIRTNWNEIVVLHRGSALSGSLLPWNPAKYILARIMAHTRYEGIMSGPY